MIFPGSFLSRAGGGRWDKVDMPTRRDTCILASAAKTGGELSCTSLSQVPPTLSTPRWTPWTFKSASIDFLALCSVCSLVAWAGALNSGALALDNVVHCNLEKSTSHL